MSTIRHDADIARDCYALGAVNERPRTVGFARTPVATIPAANEVPAGTMIYVSEGGTGAQFRGSTGAAWVNLG
jgi:hypothetical protein